MVRTVSIFACASALLACSSPEEMNEDIRSARDETSQELLERRLAVEAEPVRFVDEQSSGEAAREFAYSWPAQASAIKPLAAILGAARDEALAKQKAEWQQSIAEFADAEGGFQCFSCVNRSYAKSWSVAVDTPRFLILKAETYTYTGGAHGNSQFDAILWDRDAIDAGGKGKGAAMRPVDLFIDPVALENTAFGDYCQALLELKGERLKVDISTVSPFEDCPSVADLVVIPTSSDGATLDGVLFQAAPYVTGSFAEGPYEFAIPMTPAILTAVKPDYREHFSVPQ